MSTPFCVVFITAPHGRTAKRLAEKIVRKRLAACVNVVPRVDSCYWWRGKLESAKEALLIVKTKKTLAKSLTAFVKKIHPYTVPEVIALPIEAGHKPYLSWVREETKSQ